MLNDANRLLLQEINHRVAYTFLFEQHSTKKRCDVYIATAVRTIRSRRSGGEGRSVGLPSSRGGGGPRQVPAPAQHFYSRRGRIQIAVLQ